MEYKSWSLDNAVEIQKEFPYTFYRPPDEIIDSLKPGDLVKLIFRFESDEPDVPAAERMWVIIEIINEDGSFVGKLNNDPFHIKDIKLGNKVRFSRQHIIQYNTLNDLDIKDTNDISKYLKKCFVSNHIMHDGYKVGRLYWEEPEDENETGWTFMGDYETQEYVDDSKNLQYIAIGKVLNIDDSFINLLDEPVGSEFVRDDITGTFFKIED
ncbi:immunity protein Imm33 domain-containing protein [Mucilaginibacter sp. X5P1]|uniref:immunity protein Imm33 domain-containing protein n=1 Tax=Mucilaginibacter sp. X5P1 TaxID=2723088 RepID=UPI001617660D|nr:DUF2185 domain-containing protein [Mucilaginibacter sp. X5P1]MBB6142036.1 hypothetical protein [Mucilaginibacter sp. X5P1]